MNDDPVVAITPRGVVRSDEVQQQVETANAPGPNYCRSRRKRVPMKLVGIGGVRMGMTHCPPHIAKHFYRNEHTGAPEQTKIGVSEDERVAMASIAAADRRDERAQTAVRIEVWSCPGCGYIERTPEKHWDRLDANLKVKLLDKLAEAHAPQCDIYKGDVAALRNALAMIRDAGSRFVPDPSPDAPLEARILAAMMQLGREPGAGRICQKAGIPVSTEADVDAVFNAFQVLVERGQIIPGTHDRDGFHYRLAGR